MDGMAALRVVYLADTGVTALVPPARIIVDDALPQDTVLPAILISLVSGRDLNIADPGDTVFITQRILTQVYAASLPQRESLIRAVRRAQFANRFPVVPGISTVTVHTDGRAPNIMTEEFVRVGNQYSIVTYNQER